MLHSVLRISDIYHHPRTDSDSSSAVCVRHYVAKANTEESYGNEPHGVEKVCMLFIMESETGSSFLSNQSKQIIKKKEQKRKKK